MSDPGELPPQRRRELLRHGMLYGFLNSAGTLLVSFGVAYSRPALWIPGVVVAVTTVTRSITFMRATLAKARASGWDPVIERERAEARWAAVQPAHGRQARLIIRAPISPTRRYALIVAGVFILLPAAALVATPPPNVVGAICCGVTGAFVLFIAVRFVRLAVIGDDERLVVRNVFRTSSYSRMDVTCFEGGWPTRSELLRGARSGTAAFVHTRDNHRLQLGATAPLKWSGRNDQLEANLALLRGWLQR